MSLSSDEVNYLVWRYFQEEGLQLSAMAIDEEAHAGLEDAELQKKFGKGALVTLLLKGIQLAELENTTHSDHSSAGQMQLDGASVSGVPQLLPSDGPGSGHSNGTSTGYDPELAISGDQGHTHDALSRLSLTPAKSLIASTCVEYSGPTLALGTLRKDTELVHEDGSVTNLRYSIDNDDAEVTALAWDPAGDSLAVGSYSGGTRLWSSNGDLKRVFAFHHAPIVTLKWNRDGYLLFSADCSNATAIWDVASGDLLRKTEPATEDPGALVDMAWIDNKTYAVALASGISVQKITDPAPFTWFRGHSRAINCIVFDPESHLLASGGDDNVVNIWHGRSQAPIRVLNGHTSHVAQIRWLPGHLVEALDASLISSRLVSASFDGKVICWDLNTSAPLWSVGIPCSALILEISLEHKYMAVGSEAVTVYALGKYPQAIGTYASQAGLQSASWGPQHLAVATKDATKIFPITEFNHPNQD